MNFGFVTCVRLGQECIQEIYDIGGELDLIITLHDDLARDKSGRIYLDDFCREHEIDLIKINSVNEAKAVQAVQEYEIDWLFIIGWSQIARKEMLDAPRKGVLGIHPTLLPQGRGRAPIPWAIIKGLNKTGVTLFKLDEGVDTGPILAQEILPLAPDETATELYDRVSEAHRRLLARVWPDLIADSIEPQRQDESQATEWPKRTPADGVIEPAMEAGYVDRLVRGVTHPYPGAFFDHQNVRYRIWQGQPHPGDSQTPPLKIDSNHHLWIDLADGTYEATNWEEEELR